MKTIVLCGVILFMFACYGASAIPVGETEVSSDVEEFDGAVAEVGEVAAEDPGRYKRATCDLLSFLGFQSSICAAHCLTKGFNGGYCNSKSVCICRR